MKLWLDRFLVAVSMYSRIPVRNVKWNEESLRHSIVFLPFVGLVIGAVFSLLYFLYSVLSESYRGSLLPLFFSALAAAADFLITGGIHYDGFCDTTDALSSHQSREKKLEIMKDPHCGAFAVVSCLIVLVLKISAYTLIFQTGFGTFLVLCFGAVASRIFAAAALIVIPKAATSSLAKTFGRAADRTDLFFLFLFLLLSAFTLMICTGYVIMILIALLSAILLFFSLKKMCRKDFGGLTGDHAGYFIVRAETIWALSVACTELLLPAIEKTFI